MVANNASFNCNSAKLLVQPRGLAASRGQVVDAVQTGAGQDAGAQRLVPGRGAALEAVHRGRARACELVGTPGQGELAFALVPTSIRIRRRTASSHQEPWCTVLSETSLPGTDDPVAFLEQAVPFVNDKVWGTLCATLVVHPKSLKDPAVNAAVEKAIRELRYGAVAVNTWPAAVFALGSLPWGGHPSVHAPEHPERPGLGPQHLHVGGHREGRPPRAADRLPALALGAWPPGAGPRWGAGSRTSSWLPPGSRFRGSPRPPCGFEAGAGKLGPPWPCPSLPALRRSHSPRAGCFHSAAKPGDPARIRLFHVVSGGALRHRRSPRGARRRSITSSSAAPGGG